MIKLSEFKMLKLSITWNLIDIGFKSDTVFRDELFANDIVDYAVSLLESGNNDELILELAAEDIQNTERIDCYIKKIASQEVTNRNNEYEKWRTCYVNHYIQKKYDNAIDGLMELGDIWLKIGIDEDCPHVFQGVNNNIMPIEYYTQENYEKLYLAHQIWVRKRLSKLQEGSK